MKKIISLLLLFALALSFASCSKSDPNVPTGYKLASDAELCDYTLVVPEVWVSESTKSNYTIATISGADKCTLSVAKLENVYATTVGEYWELCKTQYGFLQNFAVVEEGAKASVGTGETLKNGYRYVFTGDYSGKSYKYMQIFLVHGNAFASSLYCITYTALADHYDSHLETMNSVLGYFSFR